MQTEPPSIRRAKSEARQITAACCSIVAVVLVVVAAAGTVAAQTDNQEPEFPSSETGARSVAENTAAGTDIGAPVAATDSDSDTLTYSLDGDDAASFDIATSSGQLRTKDDLDYEAKSRYSLTVSVSDSKDADGNPDTAVDDIINVTITVTNADEAGEVRVSPAGPQVGFVLRARLSDPDGGVRSVSWRWESSQNGTDWTNISNATRWHFTPKDTVEGRRLRVTARYRDAHGLNKTARVVLAGTVAAQERAPAVSVHTHVPGLTIPWGIAFAPDGTMLFTERSGKLSARLTDGTINSVTADFSDLLSRNEVGLMAIVVDPGFATSRRFYTCHGHSDLTVQVIAWTIDAEYAAATRASDPLVGDIPAASRHSGCRLRFGPQGNLWIATGDAAAGTTPQDLSSLGGKVLRVVASTGSGATGNPFTAAPLVYTYGHRNLQGLALRPGTSQMWVVGHGPAFDDEINLLVSGGNYGWDPVPGYNESVPMTDLVKYPGAVEAKWSSGEGTLAVSGGIFLEGGEWGEWEGRLAVASLKDRTLRLFDFAADGTLRSEVVVAELNAQNSRLRTPMMGPDGSLYISTSGGSGADKILRVAPQQPAEFDGDYATAEVAENALVGTVVATVVATDANEDSLTYSISGADAAFFDVVADSGRLSTKAVLDHDTRSSYSFTMSVHDGKDIYGNADTTVDDTISVTVTVADLDQAGEVKFSSSQPQADARFAATLTDPDGLVGSVSWAWERSASRSGPWTAVTGATDDGASSIYEPVDGDVGYYLRVTADYTDGHGPNKRQVLVSANTVREAPVTTKEPSFSDRTGGGAPPRDPLDEFSDLDEAGVHFDAVVQLVADEILARTGCWRGRLCPNEPIRRWEMAVWLIRVLTGDDPGRPNRSRFEDVRVGRWWAGHVEELARMRITLGCSTEPRLFCPNDAVTRAQTASFLVRAFELAEAGPAGFHDVDDTGHDADIDALYATKITVGCSTEPLLFCPQQPTTRAEMAGFLTRALETRGPG